MHPHANDLRSRLARSLGVHGLLGRAGGFSAALFAVVAAAAIGLVGFIASQDWPAGVTGIGSAGEQVLGPALPFDDNDASVAPGVPLAGTPFGLPGSPAGGVFAPAGPAQGSPPAGGDGPSAASGPADGNAGPTGGPGNPGPGGTSSDGGVGPDGPRNGSSGGNPNPPGGPPDSPPSNPPSSPPTGPPAEPPGPPGQSHSNGKKEAEQAAKAQGEGPKKTDSTSPGNSSKPKKTSESTAPPPSSNGNGPTRNSSDKPKKTKKS